MRTHYVSITERRPTSSCPHSNNYTCIHNSDLLNFVYSIVFTFIMIRYVEAIVTDAHCMRRRAQFSRLSKKNNKRPTNPAAQASRSKNDRSVIRPDLLRSVNGSTRCDGGIEEKKSNKK